MLSIGSLVRITRDIQDITEDGVPFVAARAGEEAIVIETHASWPTVHIVAGQIDDGRLPVGTGRHIIVDTGCSWVPNTPEVEVIGWGLRLFREPVSMADFDDVYGRGWVPDLHDLQ